MTTNPILVAILGRETLNFDDEPQPRYHFGAENAQFWRRTPISSPILVEKCSILTTSPILVTNFGRKMLNFGDEPSSRHHFEPRNSNFWRRNPFSSPLGGGKCSFLATKPFLFTILWREILFFGEEPCSRHHFEARNTPFWRRNPISLLILTELTTIKFLGIRWLNVF